LAIGSPLIFAGRGGLSKVKVTTPVPYNRGFFTALRFINTGEAAA
jgi:hypothetical protein